MAFFVFFRQDKAYMKEYLKNQYISISYLYLIYEEIAVRGSGLANIIILMI